LIAVGATDDGGQLMSQKSSNTLSRGILGVLAVSLTFGAVQFASGSDLGGSQQVPLQASSDTSEATINRAAKADRATGAAGSGIQTQTISLRSHSLPDTSVLVRIPLAQARNNPPAPTSSGHKAMLACEPVVSVLTDVARHLAPGRCVT
jgi:hypothetical protein